MIERALESARGKAQAAEVSLVRRRSTGAEYEDDRLKRVDVAQSAGLRVRVIVDGKLGSADTTDVAQMEAVVARAVEVAEFGNEARFDFPGPSAAAEVAIYDADVERTSKEALVAAGAEMLELIKGYNAEIKMSGGASWSVAERRLLNTSGLDISDRGSRFTLYAGGVLVRGTDVLQAYHFRDWRRPVVKPREVAERAIDKFRLAEHTAEVASKPMPVILTPALSDMLMETLLMGVNGKSVLKGASPLAGRLGEKLAADGFTLIDDGTVDYAPLSGSYDPEGVPRRRTEIIKDGCLHAFLYDLETAAKAGTESTGHGPGCEASNVIIAPGDAALAEMVASTREGLLVDHVLGAGQSNVINGDVSVNVSLGYKIEDGELVGRVKDTMLAGNVYDALNRIEAIGSDPEWIGSHHTPAIKIGALSVVAKG
ncbi:MAG: TldD/PmbA family protein [Armatimonadota bacterium]|nr:MAG: TldD/PmbA family protein [Armatimonadota bacterium]